MRDPRLMEVPQSRPDYQQNVRCWRKATQHLHQLGWPAVKQDVPCSAGARTTRGRSHRSSTNNMSPGLEIDQRAGADEIGAVETADSRRETGNVGVVVLILQVDGRSCDVDFLSNAATGAPKCARRCAER